MFLQNSSSTFSWLRHIIFVCGTIPSSNGRSSFVFFHKSTSSLLYQLDRLHNNTCLFPYSQISLFLEKSNYYFYANLIRIWVWVPIKPILESWYIAFCICFQTYSSVCFVWCIAHKPRYVFQTFTISKKPNNLYKLFFNFVLTSDRDTKREITWLRVGINDKL